MRSLSAILCVAFVASCANAGVVREDSLFDLLQGALAAPEAYADSMGMEVRVKRGAWDKEFKLEKMGFNFRLKYKDANNRAKGGVAEFEFEDMRKFVRRMPVKRVKLTVNFDGGAKRTDALFNLNVDYELGFLFGGQDSGKLRFDRTKDGAFYKTDVEFMSNSENNPDRPPSMKLEMKSDYKTKAEMRMFFDDFNRPAKEYKADMEFQNKETFKGKFEADGKVYNFQGTFNNPEKRFDVEVDFNGKKYNGFADADFDGQKAAFKMNFDLGAAGKLDFDFDAVKDMSSAGVKVFFNDKDVFSAKLKGKMDQAPRVMMYELRFSGMFVGDGKMRASYERFKELKFQFLPKTGMTFEHTMEVSPDRSVDVHTMAKYNDEREFEVKSKFVPVNSGDTLGYNAKMDWFVRDMSPFYRFFYRMNCMHCLAPFKVESNLAMQKNKLYKFDFDVTSFAEDGSSHKEVYVTTKDKYYAMFSENFLNEMYMTLGQYRRVSKQFEVEGEWQKGKFFKVTANRPWFNSFLIENLDGYMRKVEFNGKELMKAGFDKSGRVVKQTVELPNGEKVDTEFSWETDSFYANKAKMTFNDNKNNKVETEFDWDFADANQKSLKTKASGETEMTGKFMVKRDYEYKKNGNKQFFKRHTVTDMPNSPLPENFETEMEAEYANKNDYKFGYYMVLAGDRYGFEANKNGVNWNF